MHLLYPINVTNPRTEKVQTFDPQPVADLPKHVQEILKDTPAYVGTEPNNPQE